MKHLFILIIMVYVAKSSDCIETAFTEYEKNNFQNAIVILKQCEEEILSNEDPEEMSKYYNGIGSCYLELGILDSALKYHQISYDIKKAFNLEEKLYLSYNSLGMIFNDKGLLHKAIYYYYKAIENNIDYKRFNKLSRNYNNLANSYSSLGKQDSAINYYNLALNNWDSISQESLFHIFNNLGVLYQETRNYEKSQEYFKKSLEETSELSEFDSLISLTNYEVVNLYKGNYVDKTIFDRYIDYFSNIEGTVRLYDALYKKSLYYLSMNKKDSAFTNLFDAIEILKKNENYHRAIVLVNEFQVIAKTFNIDLGYLSKLNDLDNELANQLNLQLAANYAMEIDFRVESEKIVSNLEKEVYYAELSLYIIGLIFISIISFITLILVWISKKKFIQRLLVKIKENHTLNESNIKNVKIDLVKLMYIIDSTNDLREKEYILDLINDAINNSNSIKLKNTEYFLKKKKD